MAHSGKIKSYDVAKGTGMITPEKGGDALPFNKADLQEQAQEPREGQSYGYETRQMNGGRAHATSLQMEQGEAKASQPGEPAKQDNHKKDDHKDQASKQQG